MKEQIWEAGFQSKQAAKENILSYKNEMQVDFEVPAHDYINMCDRKSLFGSAQ